MIKDQKLNFDANDAYFLDQELVSMVDKSFATLTSPYNAELLIPTYREDDEGADTHKYFMHDTTGIADIASGADNTFPMVNVTRESKTRNYVTIGTSSFITVQDTRASRMALLNLAQDQVNAAVLRIRQAQNQMAFFGKPAAQIDGWLNAANVTNLPVAGGVWSLEVPDVILDDMCEAVDASMIATDGAVRTDTLVMPIAQYAHISCTPRSAGSDTTILQYFLNNRPEITVFAANELKGAFIGGTDGMIAYENNASWFKQLVSIDFNRRPTLAKTNGFETTFETRLGGVIVVYPESQQFRYGI